VNNNIKTDSETQQFGSQDHYTKQSIAPVQFKHQTNISFDKQPSASPNRSKLVALCNKMSTLAGDLQDSKTKKQSKYT